MAGVRPPERLGGSGAILDDELGRARAMGDSGRTVILVEGESDRRAIEALARRHERDLAAEGVEVIPVAGATNFPRFLELLGPQGYAVPLSGLCDRGEEQGVRSALERAGLGSKLDRAGMEERGFFVCEDDLEQELIRALGADRVLEVMAGQGHTRRFQRFRNQPAQRGKTIELQIWIWMGNHKMGSIGIALRKGISFHGLALNVNVDLTPFSWIEPCGLKGVSMTSVQQELGRDIPMQVAVQTVRRLFDSVLGFDLCDLSYSELKKQL